MAKSSNILLIIGATILVGGAAVALVSLSRSKASSSSSVTPQGYTLLPGCAGVLLSDEANAMDFAKAQGAKARVYTASQKTAWQVQAGVDLGFPLNCGDSFPPNSLGIVYRLYRAYISSAAAPKNGRIDVDSALTFITGLRLGALSKGVSAAELPEGLAS